MTNYLIKIKIENTTDAEALATLTWLKNTHGADVRNTIFDSTTKTVGGSLEKLTFNECVDLITDLKSQFTDRLKRYDFQISE